MRKTDCNVKISNLLDKSITIDIDDNNDPDWMDGPLTVLNGKIIAAGKTESYILRSKDERTRCWFQMNNKVTGKDGDLFHIGMTPIELKTNDGGKQAKTESRVENYIELGIKVSITVNTPITGTYSLDIIYAKI